MGKALLLFYKLLSFFAELLISYRSVYLLKLLNEKNGSNKASVFFPYDSYDCMALHRGVERAMKRNKFKIGKIELTECPNPNKYIDINESNILDFNGFIGFQYNLKSECEKRGLIDLYFPILDSIIRNVDFKAFSNNLKLNHKFFIQLEDFKRIVADQANSIDYCFLADSAYLCNQVIKQEFIKKRKKVFYLNPRGSLYQYKSINLGEFSLYNKSDDSVNVEKVKIESYVSARFSGKSKLDLDSSKAFLKKNNMDDVSIKKIFFLHAFRDANNNTWSCEQPFLSYFEWADFTFGWITKNKKWDDWYIKKHPSSAYYESDDDILRLLLDKHKVPREVVDMTPETITILKNKYPVYTNNGTVVLETLIFGYKSFYCGSRYCELLGKKSLSREDWVDQLSLSINDAYKESLIVGDELQELGKINLYASFAQKNIRDLSPKYAILPKTKTLLRVNILLSQILNTLVRGSLLKTIPSVGDLYICCANEMD